MGGSHTDSSQMDVLSPEQKWFMSTLIRQVMPEIGEGAEVYGGQVAPGVSPLQQSGFDALSGAFSGESGAALSSMLGGQSAYEVDPAAREQLYGAEKALAMRQFQSEIAPMIEERYNAAGAGRSGGMEHALAQAGGDLSLGLGSLYADLGYQDEQARRMGLENAAMRQGQGLGLWGGITGNQLAGGEMQRGVEGEQLGEGYNKWLAAQPYSNPWLTSFAPTILGTQVQTPVSETWGWGKG